MNGQGGPHSRHLPPYSPDFNTIEQAWSKVKQLQRGVKARVLDQREPAIALALGAITAPMREPSSATAVTGYSNYENALAVAVS